MRFQCLIIILVVTNNLVQSTTPNQPDLTEVELRLNILLERFLTPHALQKLIEHIMNQITPPRPPPPPEPECLCGRAQAASRILNGENVEKNEFPWQVGVKTGHEEKIFCGGSIVSTKTIVTAASCLMRVFEELLVVVAEHDLTKLDGEKYYKVCNHVVHPRYNLEKDDYDYAILTLCKELTWGLSVAPVCLPSPRDVGLGMKYENKRAIVSGWGTTPYDNAKDIIIPEKKLQKATVFTLRNEVCCAAHGAYNTPYNCSEITPRMICAAGIHKGPCRGDSGGPLVVQDPEIGAYILVGIVSWQKPPCGAPNNPGLYARVTDQLHWLHKHMEGSNCPKKPQGVLT